MHDVIDVCGRIHEANVDRIASGVLSTVGANPHDDDIVKAIRYPVNGVDNMKLIRSIIDCCFPSPSLNRVNQPSEIEDIVIEALVREHLCMQCNWQSSTKH